VVILLKRGRSLGKSKGIYASEFSVFSFHVGVMCLVMAYRRGVVRSRSTMVATDYIGQSVRWQNDV